HRDHRGGTEPTEPIHSELRDLRATARSLLRATLRLPTLRPSELRLPTSAPPFPLPAPHRPRLHSPIMSLTVAVYDTRSYDRTSLDAAARALPDAKLHWRYHDFRLSAETVGSLDGATAACVFVNDRLDARCIDAMASAGVRHIALRCAGFNNVDLPAAHAAGLRVKIGR